MMALNEYPNANNNYTISPYDDRCSKLNIDSIQSRYEYACCVFIYDLIHHNLNSNFLTEKLVWNNSRPTRNTELLKIPTYTSGYLQNQSFWSAVRQFNENKPEYVNNIERNKYVKSIKNKRIL